MSLGPQRMTYAPVGIDIIPITCSVSTSASAIAAGVGPFRGIYFITSTSVTFRSISGVLMPLDNIPKNTLLWIQGDFLAAIATATSQYGVL